MTAATLAVSGFLAVGITLLGTDSQDPQAASSQDRATPASDSSPTSGKSPTKGEDEGVKKERDPLRDGLKKSVPAGIRIPAIGVDTQLAKLGLQKDKKTMQLPSTPTRPGWYDRSPSPGEIGPSIIAGFIRTPKQPGVFSKLGKLERGDQLMVRRGDDQVAVFKVDKIKVYPKGKLAVDEVYASPRKPVLRIVTTGGTMHPDDKPGNVVVFTHLVDVHPAGSQR